MQAKNLVAVLGVYFSILASILGFMFVEISSNKESLLVHKVDSQKEFALKTDTTESLKAIDKKMDKLLSILIDIKLSVVLHGQEN